MREFTFFFKGIRDAVKLRRQISECFERASLPHTAPEVPSQSTPPPRDTLLTKVAAQMNGFAHVCGYVYALESKHVS